MLKRLFEALDRFFRLTVVFLSFSIHKVHKYRESEKGDSIKDSEQYYIGVLDQDLNVRYTTKIDTKLGQEMMRGEDSYYFYNPANKAKPRLESTTTVIERIENAGINWYDDSILASVRQTPRTIIRSVGYKVTVPPLLADLLEDAFH